MSLENQRNALNAFLYRTGEASSKIMIVYASNQPEQVTLLTTIIVIYCIHTVILFHNLINDDYVFYSLIGQLMIELMI
jgi:hypothetical protein